MSLAIFPGGTKCFNVPFGPWRDKMFHCTIVRLAEQMFSLYHCAPCGLKCYKRVTPRGSGVGFWGNLCRQEHDGPLGSVFFVS